MEKAPGFKCALRGVKKVKLTYNEGRKMPEEERTEQAEGEEKKEDTEEDEKGMGSMKTGRKMQRQQQQQGGREGSPALSVS